MRKSLRTFIVLFKETYTNEIIDMVDLFDIMVCAAREIYTYELLVSFSRLSISYWTNSY